MPDLLEFEEPIAELLKLNRVQGVAATILPETVLIHVKGHGLLTLVSNSAYSNISSMFDEDGRRLKDEDTLTIGNGVLGAYPNVLWQVTVADIPELVRRIEALRTEEDHAKLVDRFGVRRTDPPAEAATRAPGRLEAVTEKVAAALRQAFGKGPVETTMRAIVFEARA